MNIDPTKPLETTPHQVAHPNLREGQPEKFATPEERNNFFMAYLAHVATGRTDESFRYKGSGIRLLKMYKEKYAPEFPTDMWEDAQAARLLFWEDIGIEGTQGKIKNYNSDSWKFNMQNRFKWKAREDHTTDDKELSAAVQTIILDTKPSENG